MNNKIIITGCDYSTYKTDPEGKTEVAEDFFKYINGESLTQDIVNFNPTGQNDKETDKSKDADDSKYKLTGGVTRDTTEDTKRQFAGVVGTYRNPSYKYEDDIYDIEVRITSRFDKDQSKPFFLATMLHAYIEEEYDLKLSESEIPSDNIDNLFEFLKICIFRNKLISAYQKGYYKQYTYFQRNDAKLRGRIDVSRHIKLNMGMNNGRIAYEYRENTVDNPINHLILITYHVLQEKYPKYAARILNREDSTGENASQILQSLEYMMSDYKDKSIGEIIRKSRPSIRHPYFSEYEELRKVCLDILNGVLDISPYTDEKENEVQSMLFYVPDLWEVCVYHFLKDVLKEKGLLIVQQDEVALLKRHVCGSEKSETEKKRKVETIGKKRPDFVLYCNDEAQAVLDAKFKPTWEDLKKNYDSLKSDVEQCITYAMLKNTDYTGTIFPLKAESKQVKTRIDEYLIGETDKNFAACGILVPEIKEEESFENWYGRLKDEFKKFTEILLQDWENNKDGN